MLSTARAIFTVADALFDLARRLEGAQEAPPCDPGDDGGDWRSYAFEQKLHDEQIAARNYQAGYDAALRSTQAEGTW